MSLAKFAQKYWEDDADLGFVMDKPITLDSASDDDKEIPDYEPCGDCGYDHGYEYEEAHKWHSDNPGSYDGIDGINEMASVEPFASNDNESISIDEDDVPEDFDDSGLEEYGIFDDDVTEDIGDSDDQDEDEEDVEEDEPVHELGESEVVVSIADEDGEPRVFKFDLPLIPGAELDAADLSIEEEPEEDVEIEEKDMWDWQSGGLNNFIPWLFGMFNNIPKHSGHDTAGIERVIAFLTNLNKIILTLF